MASRKVTLRVGDGVLDLVAQFADVAVPGHFGRQHVDADIGHGGPIERIDGTRALGRQDCGASPDVDIEALAEVPHHPNDLLAVLCGRVVEVAATVAGFGVVLGAFATLVGALSLAVGFAAQDLIANFVAGVFILHDEPFVVGDWIEWDGNTGVVRKIQLRVTKIETFDNELITVPNSHLANEAVTNPVANDQVRVTYDFGIGYDDDIKQARHAIVDEGTQIDGVLDDPEPTAPVTELGGSSVVLSGRVWIDPNENSFPAVRAKFVEAVKERLDAEGIDIPYATTELTGGLDVKNIREVETVTGD